MALSVDFKQQTETILGEEANELFQAIEQTNSVTSVRLHPVKGTAITWDEQENVAWCSNGFYLKNRPKFTFDPMFHAGAYYVQEASSMFVQHALNAIDLPKEELRVLDLCAAPGGKTTLVAEWLEGKGQLIANEIISSRAQILKENVIKSGWGNVMVTNNAPTDFTTLRKTLDVLVIDAPCSGEGMFRKDTGAINEWSLENVNICAQRQEDILEDVLPCLKEGGYIIYSTCTYNLKENEDIVSFMCSEYGLEVIALNPPDEWNITDNDNQYHFYPHKTKGEGFFLTLLKKSGDWAKKTMKSQKLKSKKKKQVSSNVDVLPYEKWLNALGRTPDVYTLTTIKEQVHSVTKQEKEWIDKSSRTLYYIYAGIEMGEVKKNKLIPAHALALTMSLKKEGVVTAEVSKEEALDFLSKKEIKLSTEINKGYVLITYQNMGLGFVNHLGNRSNNLYPKHWRILSDWRLKELE